MTDYVRSKEHLVHEHGFHRRSVYLRGDGGPKPARVHFRTPSYVNLASLAVLSKDLYVADLVAIIGSIDIVLGEIDR